MGFWSKTDNAQSLANAQTQAADRLRTLESQGKTGTAEYQRLAERSYRIANR
jgi:hypothetical protein